MNAPNSAATQPAPLTSWPIEATTGPAVLAPPFLYSSETVLEILKLILAGSELSEVLTVIARLVESQCDPAPRALSSPSVCWSAM
jgi:hypothetical protein